MMYFCTYSDSKYTRQGLAMHASLEETIAGDFILYWLCLDDEIFNTITKLNIATIKPVNITELESKDEALIKLKANPPPSQFGNSHSWYCWSASPYWINYVLKTFVPDEQWLLYCDTDIFFYGSADQIIKAAGEKSVAIHTHRFANYTEPNPVGEFNVGVLGFRNNRIGCEVSETWKNWLLDINNQYYKTHGQCGDQCYLTLWKPLWGEENICVFDKDNHILHGAPWATHNIENQEILFWHFSHFSYDLNNDSWKSNYNGEWRPENDKGIFKYYHHYFEVIKWVDKKYLNNN